MIPYTPKLGYCQICTAAVWGDQEYVYHPHDRAMIAHRACVDRASKFFAVNP